MKFLFVLIGIVLVASCSKDDEPCGCAPPPSMTDVYKMRADYSDYVCVMLSKDKKRISGYPVGADSGGDSSSKPIKVANGYYMGSWANYGVNSAYLNITRKEYQSRGRYLTKDSLMNMILDADPYLEYYKDEKRVLDANGYDSSAILLNQIILNNELATKLKRVK